MRGIQGFVTLIGQVALAASVAITAGVSSGPALADEDTGHSIILTLRGQSEDVRTAVLGEAGLAPKVEGLRASLGESADETQRAHEDYTQNPTEAAALRYEDAFSRGLIRTTQGLEGILDEEDDVLPATDALRTSVQEAKRTFGKRVERYRNEAAERAQQSERLYASLEELAGRYADVIDSGQELPPDADLAVRRAYKTWKTSEARVALYEGANVRMQAWVDKVGTYDAVLLRVRGEYELIFAQARDQVDLLRDVAVVRGDEVEITGFIRELASVTRALGRARNGMDGVLAGIDGLLAAPPLLNPEDEPDPQVNLARGQGINILRQILDAKKGENDAS